MNLLRYEGGLVSGSILSPVTVANLDFVRNGKIEKHRCVTGFTFWQDFIKGEYGKLEEYVGFMVDRRFNCLRSFGTWGNTLFKPVDNPTNYHLLQKADEWLNNRGMTLLLTVNTDQVDNSPVLMTEAEQDYHLINCLHAMRVRRTGKIEFVNEYGKNWKRPWPTKYDNNHSIFNDVVSTWSTWSEEADPEEIGHYMNFVTKHTGGYDPEFSRKSKQVFEAQRQGLGSYPPAHRPCIIGEKARIAEGSSPREHADATAIEEGLGSGGCLHGGFNSLPQASHHDSDLQNCSLKNMRGNALECIEAVSQVFKAGIRPETASIGNYSNGPNNGVLEHDDNKMLRTYVMTEGNRATAFRVKGIKEGQPIVPVNDWKVKDARGYEENVVFLER